MLQNMEIHEIRYFMMLSQTLNFTRAAESCNVSQPALTRAIQNLEDKLGAGPLVNRERGNTHLTELGHIMVPYFEQVLAGVEQAQVKAQSYRQSSVASLSLGLMCTIGPSRMVVVVSFGLRDRIFNSSGAFGSCLVAARGKRSSSPQQRSN